MIPRPSLGGTPFSLSARSTLPRRTSHDETTHHGHLRPHPTFSINTSLQSKLKVPQNFKEKPEISLSLSLVSNRKEPLVSWTSQSQLTKRDSLVLLILRNQLPIHKSLSRETFCLECLEVLVHASKVSKSSFHYALVYLDSSTSMFLFQVLHLFFIVSMIDLGCSQFCTFQGFNSNNMFT